MTNRTMLMDDSQHLKAVLVDMLNLLANWRASRLPHDLQCVDQLELRVLFSLLHFCPSELSSLDFQRFGERSRALRARRVLAPALNHG
jgi:hypothetical protein